MSDENYDILLNKTVRVKRDPPMNLERKDVGLFQHEFEIIIDVPQFKIFKNIIINSKGFCYKYFSKHPINKSFDENRIGERNTIEILKDLLNIVLNRNKISLSKICWVTDAWSANYFHWLTDVIPKLIYVEKMLPGYTVVLPRDLLSASFVKRSLNYFKLNYLAISHYQKVTANFFLGLPNFANTGNFLPGFILDTRKIFLPVQYLTSKRIFVKRKSPYKRRVLNEEEISIILKKYSFDIIDTAEMGLPEQIALFSQVNILIAVHGAALTNMLFMPKKGKVLELRKEGDSINNCYFSLASAVDLAYYYQLCKVDNPGIETQSNNFYVDAGLLEKNIQLMLQDA
ncbi:MAG: glycosyltransferase family 61 protein [Ferruginibacter sp.]|nr:glycosyltransferase family 61 protein [Ferruginibacter sp.]